MADSYSWLNLSMRAATVLCWSYEGPLIILVAINASIALSIVTIQDGHSKGRG